MAKSNVSEWDVVADNNTRVGGVNIDENCPPSAINNGIREVMAQIKQWKDGYNDPITGLPVFQSLAVQNITVNGSANFNGAIKLNNSAGTDGQVLVSKGASASPVWGNSFIKGMIMLWSGSEISIPDGWALCDGKNETPDLKQRFVVGAGSGEYVPNRIGGYKDSVVVAHNHSFTGGTTNSAGNHRHAIRRSNSDSGFGGSVGTDATGSNFVYSEYAGAHTHTISGSISSKGESGTNKNLPPYYCLCYIMKL